MARSWCSCAARRRTAKAGSRIRPANPAGADRDDLGGAHRGRRARGSSAKARRRRCRRTDARSCSRRTDRSISYAGSAALAGGRGEGRAGRGAGPSRTHRTPLIKAWGTNGDAELVAGRDRSSRSSATASITRFIGVYDVRTRSVTFLVAERRSRHEPDVVARRQARRVHSPAGHAVRPAGAAGHGQHRQSRRPGLQPADRAARRRGGGGGRGGRGARRRPSRSRRSAARV